MMDMEIAKYNLNDAEIAKMKDLYMELAITDITNEEEFKAVHDSRMIIKGHRVNVEKKRKAFKSESLVWGRKVDKEAKRIFELLKPIELHLAAEEKKVTDEKNRIKAEEEAAEKKIVEAMVKELLLVNVVMSFFDVAMLEPDAYTKILFDATAKLQAEKEQKAEEAKLKAEEEKKLAEEQAEIARVQVEQKEQAEVNARKEKELNDKLKAIEDEKKADQERKEREAFEKKVKEDAEAKAKKDAEKVERARIEKEKADREAKEREIKETRFASLRDIGHLYPFGDLGIMPSKQYIELYEKHKTSWDAKQKEIMKAEIEKERVEKEKAEKIEAERKENMRPSKDRLHDFADGLLKIQFPALEYAEAVEIIQWAGSELKELSKQIKLKADNL